MVNGYRWRWNSWSYEKWQSKIENWFEEVLRRRRKCYVFDVQGTICRWSKSRYYLQCFLRHIIFSAQLYLTYKRFHLVLIWKMQIQLYFYSAVTLQCQVLFADVSLYDVIFKVGSKSEKYKLTVGGFKGSWAWVCCP